MDIKLKICIITPQYGHLWSGVGTYATHLVNGLAERGHDITVICPDVSERKINPKVKVINMEGLNIKPTLGNWVLLSYHFNKHLQRLVAKEYFNIVHYVDARDSYFCKIKNIPVVGTIHDYYFVEAFKNPLLYKKYYDDWIKRWGFYNLTRILEKKGIKKLSFVITNSNYVKESIVRNYYDGKKTLGIKSIYIGIERSLNSGFSYDNKDKLKGNPAILFVGQNFQRKGLPVLIQALADVKRVLPEATLYVVGRYKNNKEEEMMHLSKSLGIADNISFLGWKDNEEVKNLFKKVDVFAMPSLIEGFGLVFLEAMNAGVPVIGGKTGGTPELIEDGVNGFLVKPGDWIELSEKIQIIMKDDDCKERFIQNGYNTFEKFSVERMVEETIDVYLNLV